MHSNLLLRKPTDSKLYVEDVFSTYLYTGNGSTQTITNGIDLAGKGGLVWLKRRDAAGGHTLFDTERGATKALLSNDTGGQSTFSTTLTSFSSTGFALGSGFTNDSGAQQASWTFRKAPKFFDVVTWTANGSAQNINHNLGIQPGMIIVKATSGTSNWFVWHIGSGVATSRSGLSLNTTNASAYSFDVSSSITSTSFNTLYINDHAANTPTNNGVTYVAYIFAHDTTADGVIHCGSFTKDGSNNATVTLGWEPQYVLVKSTNGSGVAVGDSWLIADIMRGASESLTNYLRANTSDADATNGGPWCVPTATGFKIQGLSGGSNHIYIAIRRGPMRVPTDATKVFAPDAWAEVSNPPGIGKRTFGFPVDFYMMTRRSGGYGYTAWDRLRGLSADLILSQTAPEGSYSSFPLASMDSTGVTPGFAFNNTSGSFESTFGFGRAPGFFDVVCYTGTGSKQTVNHNLGVTPELIIMKKRSSSASAGDWTVYDSFSVNPDGGSTYPFMILNRTDGRNSGAYSYSWVAFGNQRPTSTVFYTNDNYNSIDNAGKNVVAYLFASCPGVSKVGSYTGNGSSQNIDCGFTNGARFVLIKRTDSTGDWYVWDTARGIVSANDPHLSLNSTAAEVTTDDSIDPLSTGFTVNQVSATNVNVSGATYIYLAIA